MPYDKVILKFGTRWGEKSALHSGHFMLAGRLPGTQFAGDLLNSGLI
jgi:hypothetical protein